VKKVEDYVSDKCGVVQLKFIAHFFCKASLAMQNNSGKRAF